MKKQSPIKSAGYLAFSVSDKNGLFLSDLARLVEKKGDGVPFICLCVDGCDPHKFCC